MEGYDLLRRLVGDYWRPALEAQLIEDAKEWRKHLKKPLRLSTVALAR